PRLLRSAMRSCERRCVFSLTALRAVRDTGQIPSLHSSVSGKKSWTQPIHRARERDRFPDVMYSTDPANGSLETQAESCVNEGPVFSQVEVPVVRFDRETFLLDPRQQLIVIVFAL